MPGWRVHPLDAPLKAMVDAMLDADKQMAQMTSHMGDFDSKQLSAEEDEQLFAKPAMRYLTEKNPQTGQPYTDPEAAQRLLEEMGPEQYVAYVHDFVRRYDRRHADDPSPPPTAISSVSMPGRAAGGPVDPDQPYMVGEQGPEMFVPSTAGAIVPNAAIPDQAATPDGLDDISTVGGTVSSPPPPMPAPQPAADRQTPPDSTVPADGDVAGWRSWMKQYVPPQYANDPEFLNTVLTGAHGESGLRAGIDQPAPGYGHGLFQFDNTPGSQGMGVGLTDAQLHDPLYQIQHIMPAYAAAYAKAPAGLSGAQRASWVAANAEHPLGFNDPNSASRQNYVRSYGVVTGGT